MSAIGILTYLFGVIFLVSASGFAYYALRNTRLMRGALGHRLMAAGSITSVVALIVNTTEFLLFPRPIMALCALGVWILAILLIVSGGILRAEDIRRVLKISWIESIRVLAPAKYYLIGIPVLLCCNIPVTVWLVFYGYYGITAIDWFDTAGAFTLAIAFLNLVVGERRLYLTARPSAAVASSKEIGLLRSDMLAVKCCEVLTNTFLARIEPAVSNGLIRKTLADYFEYNPILFEGCRLKEDGSIDVAPMMVNLNRISRGNRAQTVCTSFATLNSKVMNLYGAVTSPELARKTLEDSYVAVKEQYGDIPVPFNILRTMPKGVLENEKLALLSKVELEAKVEERTQELKEAYRELAEAKEYLDSIIKSMSDILIVIDPEGKMKTINRVTVEILGYEEDELIGQPVNKVFAPADSLFRDGGLGRLIREGSVQSYEIGVKTKDGRIIPFDVNTSPIMEGGKLKALQIVARDITERKKAEELYMTVAKSSQVGIYIVQDGKFQFVNPQFQRYTGFSQDELLGMDSLSIVHPEDRQMVREDAIEMLRGQRSSAYEFRSISKDGQVRWVMETVTPIQYRGNRATLGNYMDITERKEAEEALRETRDYLENLINYANAPIIVWNPEFKVTQFNHAFERLTGYTSDEVVGQELSMLFPEASRNESLKKITRTLSGEYWESVEIPILCKDGDTRLALWNSANIYAEDNRTLWATIAQGQDITRRKQAEELYTTLANSPQVGVFVVQDGKLQFLNPYTQQYSGFTADELLSMDPLDFVHPEDREMVRENTIKMLKGERSLPYEFRSINKYGQTRWVAQTVTSIQYQGKRAVLGNNINITERKEAEQELLRLSSAVKMSKDSIIISNLEGKIVDANEATLEMYGTDNKEDLIGKDSFDLIAPEDRERAFAGMQEVMEKGYVQGREYHIAIKEGSRIPVEMNVALMKDPDGRPAGFVAVSRDITERKKAEQTLKEYSAKLEDIVQERTRELQEAQEQLVRKERLAVLGQLAGGVGHELRNPLGVISNAVYLLHIILPNADERAREYLDIISSEVDNAEKIVSDLLDFSRTKHPEREKIAISDLVAQVLEKQAPPEGVKVSTKIAPNLPLLFIDPRQIGQVLGNMVTNACEAMPDGGKLTIFAQTKEGMVQLSISDTGCGISKENMKRLFEPLFTTKVKGIGLGLSMSKNLVEANGGSIKVQSKEGKGTTFTLRLPVGS